MRYVETLTAEHANRLQSMSQKGLLAKVASSKAHQHRGYPDATGWAPYIVIDPEHQPWTDESLNLCWDADPKRTTVFTAALGFPHLTARKGARNSVSLKKVVSAANCDSSTILGTDDDVVETVLYERERLRMDAINPEHKYALDDETKLTADPVDKILINAARAAERRDGAITLDGIKEVLTFKRNNLEQHLPFAVEEMTVSLVRDRIGGKTCSPPLPENEDQQTVLLYWIDHPDASITDVVRETGISRGRFETFRLNRPDPTCYKRSYIESLDYDTESLITQLNEWMTNSTHDLFTCLDCGDWCYSEGGLRIHKSNSADHPVAEVTDDERPRPKQSKHQGRVTEKASHLDADDLLAVFNDIKHGNEQPEEPDDQPPADTAPEPTSVPERPPLERQLAAHDNPLAVIAATLDEPQDQIVGRLVATLSDEERRVLETVLLEEQLTA